MSFKRNDILSVYFGVPGSGKTTMAAWLAKRDLKHGLNVWSNVPITGTYKLDPPHDLGFVSIEDGRIIIDEASVEYNNRNFKSMPQETIKFLKYHRHWRTAIDVFSQSYDDMDITLRRLAQKFYVVKRGILPWFITVKLIKKKIGIDDQTHQIIDQYDFLPFIFGGTRIIFSPVLWKLFNTLSHESLPEIDFKKW